MQKLRFVVCGLTLAFLGLFATPSSAAVTCTLIPNSGAYDCETSTTGPLANFWDWGVSGNFLGDWFGPDQTPQRVWLCGPSGTTNTRVFVIIGFTDGSFVTEDAFIDCSVAPPPPPTTAGFTIEWEYCAGLTATYAFNWWTPPGTIGPISYELEQRVSGVWMPAYSGTSTHQSFGCTGNTYFRVKAINSAGSSPWTYRWANHNCGDDAVPF